MHKFEQAPDEKKVLTTEWGLTTQDVYRKISNVFDTSRGGAQRCIMEVFSTAAKQLYACAVQQQYQQSWRTEHQKAMIAQQLQHSHPAATQCLANAREIEQKYGFPEVCGCLDGTHIRIKPPSSDRDSYVLIVKVFLQFLRAGSV